MERILVNLGFLILFVGGSVGFVTWTYVEYSKGAESADWPNAAGQVLSSEVGTRPGGEDSRGTYVPQVTYRYVVNGVTFSGDTIRFGLMGDSSRDDAEEAARKYRVGAPVTVYYDHANPTSSVLEPGGSVSWLVIGMVAAVGWLLLGLVLLVLERRDKA